MSVTEEAKRRLISAYQESGDMAHAMRAAGIRSRSTAYRWWNRYRQSGEAGLVERSHARKSQQTPAPEHMAAMQDLQARYPQWGRRRIAAAINAAGEAPVISSSAVGRALRQVAARNTHETGWDWERFRYAIQQGLQASYASQAEEAVRWLSSNGWNMVDRAMRLTLLCHPHVGRLLLRSRLQLGHSYMNTGEWALAESCLQEVFDWMFEVESDLRFSQREAGSDLFSLRWDDIWVETLQYLSIVMRATQPQLSLRHVHMAYDGLLESGASA